MALKSRMELLNARAGTLIRREIVAARPAPKAITPEPPPTTKDLGTAVRIARGDLQREFRDDPEMFPARRLVRGARVRDSLHIMFNSRLITRPQWQAVERMRDEMALAGGAQPDALDASEIRSTSLHARWPADVQLGCLDRCRRLWRVLEAAGLETIVDWTVVGGRTLDDWATTKKCRREQGRTLLGKALDCLVLFYSEAGDRT